MIAAQAPTRVELKNAQGVAVGTAAITAKGSGVEIALDLKGLPVKAINPVEGAPYVRFDGALFKGAPHPNAGRLLLDFFLSDEGQLAYGNLGFVPTVGGLDGKISAEARARAREARPARAARFDTVAVAAKLEAAFREGRAGPPS